MAMFGKLKCECEICGARVEIPHACPKPPKRSAIEEYKTWKCAKCGRVFHGTEKPKSCSECDSGDTKYKRASIVPLPIEKKDRIFIQPLLALYYGDHIVATAYRTDKEQISKMEAVAQQLNDCIENGP